MTLLVLALGLELVSYIFLHSLHFFFIFRITFPSLQQSTDGANRTADLCPVTEDSVWHGMALAIP
jgi:hypothetical protein